MEVFILLPLFADEKTKALQPLVGVWRHVLIQWTHIPVLPALLFARGHLHLPGSDSILYTVSFGNIRINQVASAYHSIWHGLDASQAKSQWCGSHCGINIDLIVITIHVLLYILCTLDSTFHHVLAQEVSLDFVFQIPRVPLQRISWWGFSNNWIKTLLQKM